MRITYVMLFLASITAVHARSITELSLLERIGLPDPLGILVAATAIAGFALAFALYYKKAGPSAKKIAFICIAAPVALATIYLGVSTVYLNLVSSSQGPVHWHQDFEVWACGQKYELVNPKGLDNRVGTPLLHEHNDNRVHIEGVVLQKGDVSLGEFFMAVGGGLTSTSLTMPTEEGIRSWTNGERCNGQPARLYMFVNEELNDEFDSHIPAPYTDIPPGDFIKLVFTEKTDNQINTKMFEVP